MYVKLMLIVLPSSRHSELLSTFLAEARGVNSVRVATQKAASWLIYMVSGFLLVASRL